MIELNQHPRCLAKKNEGISLSQLGEPNKFREQHSVNGFERRGVEEKDQRLLERGSGKALVYSREKVPTSYARTVLSDRQLTALYLYCHGKSAGEGRPSQEQYDGLPKDGQFCREPEILRPMDIHGMSFVRFFNTKYKNETEEFLASGLWRIFLVPEHLPVIRWQAISRRYTRSDNYDENVGSFKTYMGETAEKMAVLLDTYKRANPDVQPVLEDIDRYISELFSI